MRWAQLILHYIFPLINQSWEVWSHLSFPFTRSLPVPHLCATFKSLLNAWQFLLKFHSTLGVRKLHSSVTSSQGFITGSPAHDLHVLAFAIPLCLAWVAGQWSFFSGIYQNFWALPFPMDLHLIFPFLKYSYSLDGKVKMEIKIYF